MPQVITAAITQLGGPFGLGGALVGDFIGVPISGGIIGNLLGIGGPKRQKPSDGQRTVRVSVGSRVRHYGKVRVAGQLTFYESKDGTLYTLVTTGQGRVSAITEYQLNAEPVTVNASGLVTDAKYQSAVSIHNRLGTDDQLAYSQLSSVFSEWTANHRQRGCSSILVVARGVDQEDFAQVYEGSREPQGTVTMETTLVYDPRLDSTQQIGTDANGDPIMGSGPHRKDDPSTFAYSSDWSLCFADYLAHPDGYGLGWDMINWANVAAEADISEATVTTVDNRTIARWRVGGSYNLADDERRTVVNEFLKAADGFMWQDENGLANIRCGRWIEPTVHIPEKHVIGLNGSLGTSATDRANEVRVIYTEPRFDYQETEAAPLVNDAAKLALGRPEVTKFDAYYCPDHNQAQRIGKRLLARLGERWQLQITTNLYGLNAIGQRFISLTVSELNIDALFFEITSMKINPAQASVELGLSQVKPDDFEFDAATEEGNPPGDVPVTSVPIVIETVSNLSLSAVQIAINGGGGVGIQATWDAPVRVGLITQVQFKQTSASEWMEMTVSQSERLATTGIISTGVQYQVRARHITVRGRPSEWSAIETITPTVAESAPSTPTQFSGSAGANAGEADLTWRNPSETNFEYVQLYRHTEDNFSGASQVGADMTGALGEVMTFTDTGLAADDYYYWVRAFSTSDLASPVSSSVMVTVV